MREETGVKVWALIVLAILMGIFLLLVVSATNAQAGSPLNVAKKYNGSNPTGWSRSWCGKFVDMTLKQAGKPGGGNLARGYASYGRPTHCRVGAIAVMATHVGYVTGCHGDSVSVLSGNHSGKAGRRTVGYGRYRMSRIIAFRMP